MVVFSVLDSRVSCKGKYRKKILEALPKVPVINDIEAVKEFIIANKEAAYFMDGNENEKLEFIMNY